MKCTTLVIGLLTVANLALGQGMRFFADVMTNADAPEHRIFASEQFVDLFEEELSREASFQLTFDALSWISIQYPLDSSFRILSWQVDAGEGKFLYAGYLQTKDGDFAAFGTSTRNREPGPLDVFAWSEWSGGLVYDICGASENGYVLLAYRQIDEYTKLKMAEIVQLNSDEIFIGAPVFQREEGGSEYVNRLKLQYSSDSNVALTYIEQSDQIVFDNLIPVMGRLPGQGPTQVSDGSYMAYRPESGKWKKIEKLFNQVLDVPPRVARDKENRDIFGRKKN